MNLSAQKLDLDDMARNFEKVISELNSRRAILIRGMEALDKGVSMIDGKGILAGEVKKIMSEGISFI